MFHRITFQSRCKFPRARVPNFYLHTIIESWFPSFRSFPLSFVHRFIVKSFRGRAYKSCIHVATKCKVPRQQNTWLTSSRDGAMAVGLVAAGRTRTEETTGRCLTKEARENREKGNEESQDEPTREEVTKFAWCWVYFFACLFPSRSLLWRLFILWEGLLLIFIYKSSLLPATNLLRLGPLRYKYGRNRSEWAKRYTSGEAERQLFPRCAQREALNATDTIRNFIR